MDFVEHGHVVGHEQTRIELAAFGALTHRWHR